MKHTWTIVLSLLIAMFFLITTAAYATESVVFVDDDPVNSDGQTFYVGTWTQSTFFPQTYGQGYHFSRSTGGSLTMRATLDIDETGGGADNVSGSQFQAFARWSAGNNRCSAVRVEVRNASTNTLVTSEIVNQTTQGLQFNWTPIGGRFTAVPNQLYEIRFISPGVCVTTVDGGMFVQQTYDSSDVFNLNNGSIIDEPGVDFSTTNSVSIASTSVPSPTLLTSRTISCPGSGTRYVVATGSAWFTIYSGSNSTSNISSARTSLSSTGSWNLDTEGWEGLRQNITSINTLIGRGTISKTHVFTCSGGNSLTISFFAVRSSAGSFTSANDVSLVLTVFPTRY